MKKVLIISFLLFTIIISCFSTSYAAITVTEEALEQAFNNFISNKAEDNTTNYSMNIDKPNKTISLSVDDEDLVMDYDLSNKPRFKTTLSFNNKMSEDDFTKETEKSTTELMMLILIADIAGINIEDSTIYMFTSLFKNANFSETLAFTNGIETAKAMYDKEPAFSDDLYTMTYKKISDNTNEYNVQAILEIDNAADFSIMNGISDSLLGENITIDNADYPIVLKVGQKCKIESNKQITGHASIGVDIEMNTNPYEITGKQVGVSKGYLNIGDIKKTFYITVEENIENKELEPIILKIEVPTGDENSNTTVITNTSSNLQQSVNKVVNSINKLPQTGDSFGLKNGLYILCITSSIALIYVVFKSVKYKNVEK